MIIVKGHNNGKYQQTVKIAELDGVISIYDITCDCRYGTIHPEAWKEGLNLCKHIKKVLENESRLET